MWGDRARAEGPLEIPDGETAGLLDCLLPYDHILLAVSGGPDSMALMHLVARWMRLRLRAGERVPSVTVATIDHQLRPEAGAEAHWVAEQAAHLCFPHLVRVWEGERPPTGVQAAARAARYRLLTELAAAKPSSAVATGHTADDQAETMLMRLKRGSGLDGLAGMAKCRELGPGVDLVRPLLGVPKRRLLATLEAAQLPWLSDPSNERTDFERVRVRRAMTFLEDVGFSPEAFSLSAGRLARARAALEHVTAEFCERKVDLHEGLYASLARADFAGLPEEVRVRVLGRLLAAFGGKAPRARLVEVEGLVARLGGQTKIATTLGGAAVSAGERLMRIYREIGRAGLETVELRPGERAIWDDRFLVHAGEDAEFRALGVEAPLRVQALSTKGYATLEAQGCVPAGLPARALATIPAFWSGQALVSVPLLGYGGCGRLADQQFLGWAGDANRPG